MAPAFFLALGYQAIEIRNVLCVKWRSKSMRILSSHANPYAHGSQQPFAVPFADFVGGKSLRIKTVLPERASRSRLLWHSPLDLLQVRLHHFRAESFFNRIKSAICHAT